MRIFLALFANSLISLVSANSASSVIHPEGLTLLRWRTSSAFLRSRFSLQSSLTPCSCSYFHPARLTGCSIIGGDPPRASPVFSKIDECSEAQGVMFIAKFPGSTLHTSFILVFLFSCALQAPATLLLCALLWEHSWQLPRLPHRFDAFASELSRWHATSCSLCIAGLHRRCNQT